MDTEKPPLSCNKPRVRKSSDALWVHTMYCENLTAMWACADDVLWEHTYVGVPASEDMNGGLWLADSNQSQRFSLNGY